MISLKFRTWLAGSLALAGIVLVGETLPQSASAPAIIAESPPASEGELRTAALLSPQLRALLSTALPAYEPVKPIERGNADWTALAIAHTGTGEVFVLPRFTIRGPRLPKPQDLLTLEGKMNQYLGPKDGLDRGVLNRVVLHWDFGWYSVVLFDAVKNEARAEDMYFEDQRLRRRADLLDFADRLKLTGDVEGVEFVQRESDRLFFRKSPFKRK